MDVVLLGQFAHIDEGVAHTAEGGVDADVGLFSDFLETQVFVETHEDDFALCFGQEADEGLYLVHRLGVDHFALTVLIDGNGGVVEEGAVAVVVGDHHSALAQAVVVDDEVVGDAHDPGGELSVLGVLSVLQLGDDFHEAVLEEVLCDFFVLNGIEDVGVNFAFVAFEQTVEGGVITIDIGSNQLFVGLLCGAVFACGCAANLIRNH